MLPFLPRDAGPAILLRFIDVFVYAVVLLFLLRYAMRGYYLYGYGVWTTALFNYTEILCRPLRSLLPASWYGVKDRVPLVAALLIVALKPFAQAAVIVAWLGRPEPDSTLLPQSWVLSIFFLSTGTENLCLHAAYLGSALLFLAFSWQQAGGFWRPLALQVLDESTVPFFRRTAARFRLKSNWPVLITALLTFNLYCGLAAATASLLGRLLAWPAWNALGNDFKEQMAWIAPAAPAAAVHATALLASFVLVPAWIILHVLMVAAILLVILSWFSPNPNNLPFRLLFAVGGPPLLFAHRLAPWARIGILDFSPILLFVALRAAIVFLEWLLSLVNLLSRAAA
ncbi:YggT family protein [bacterium]|nr:YggT family protein [bacterium]